jgi:hypothetical protein
MPPEARPLVYCETNWILALALPHHRLHRPAADLLQLARSGGCDLRVPLAALLEAPNAIRREMNTLTSEFTSLADKLRTAVSNGVVQLEPAKAALANIEPLKEYLRRPIADVAANLRSDPAVTVLLDQTVACDTMGQILPRLNFSGKDTVDLFVLGAVVGDRAREEPARPAIFFSTNRDEFRPKDEAGAKIPADFYVSHRLLWREDFDFSVALRLWRDAFEAPARALPLEDDVATIDGLVRAFYACVGRDEIDRERLASLFAREARIFELGSDGRAAGATVMNVEQFSRRLRTFATAWMLAEVEGDREVRKIGAITQILSACEMKSRSGVDMRVGAVVIQVIREKDRCWVLSVVWSSRSTH